MNDPAYVEKYHEYEKAWRQHVDRVNCDRFCGGRFPARFSAKDKQEFIRTLAVIDSCLPVEPSNARLK